MNTIDQLLGNIALADFNKAGAIGAGVIVILFIVIASAVGIWSSHHLTKDGK